MFCDNCGNMVNEKARFCSSCGVVLRKDEQQATPQQGPPASPSASANKQRKAGRRILMLLVSMLLVLMGTGFMALTLVGKTVTAQITGYEQKIFINNDSSTRNPSLYKVDYGFTVNGEKYAGSVTRVFTGGSHMRKTMTVRYLPFWPHVNAEDSDRVSPTGFIIIGIGILMFVLEVKRKPRIGKEG